jgi:ABC-2 type transport system ATP-binding protein
MALIETQQLTKRYNGLPALEDVTVEIPEGSVGLLGENGAGKTTFIKLLLGLLRPTAGTARVLGLDVRNATQRLELRRRVGYMPEDDCLPPDFSAFDFLVRLAKLSGLPYEDAVQRTHDVLHLVGLGEERYRPIGGYSTGMRQRVKLAQALVHDPKLVLLDEPTSGLDPAGREEMLALIADIRRKMGLSLLFSTHLLPDVERVCESIVILRAGRVTAQGPLQELLGGALEGVRVRVGGAKSAQEAFVRALKDAGLRVELQASGELLIQSGQQGNEGEETYTIILQAAAETGVQLRRLERQTRTLEDLFLELHPIS